MDNKLCFVIQPFDKEYNQLYQEIYKPAIEDETGISAYRVDEDPEVTILIDSIEQHIKNSVICFADITENNPNVWYELGYARACGKNVVIVCNRKRDKLPFDISHLATIFYQNNSPSDFSELKKKITEKIKALYKKGDTRTEKSIAPQPVMTLKTDTFFNSEKNYRAILTQSYQSVHSYFEYICTLDASICKQLPNPIPINAQNREIEAAWRIGYKSISQLNIIIERKDESPFDCTKYISTARVLRAVLYLDMTQHWGDIPFIMMPPTAEMLFPREQKEKIWDRLIDDLKSSMHGLKQSNNENDELFVAPFLAQYVMAIIHLEKKEVHIATKLLKEIIDSNTYQLVTGSTIYNERNKDSLFSLSYSADEKSNFPLFMQIKKGFRHPLYRYAGICINYIEALYRIGHKEETVDSINSIRQQIGIEALSPTNDIAREIAFLWNKIIGMDYGYYSLLKRLELAIPILNIDNHLLLLPIPESELQTNPRIIQNPGY
jgi:SusD family.